MSVLSRRMKRQPSKHGLDLVDAGYRLARLRPRARVGGRLARRLPELRPGTLCMHDAGVVASLGDVSCLSWNAGPRTASAVPPLAAGKSAHASPTYAGDRRLEVDRGVVGACDRRLLRPAGRA
jgi:hypothetical protein